MSFQSLHNSFVEVSDESCLSTGEDSNDRDTKDKIRAAQKTEGRSRGQSESYSQNMQRLGRELMTTSEITTMPGDKCILQLRGLPPFLSPKYDLKKHPNYKYTAEFDKKKNAFRLESLFRHRPLRLKPEDEYTVYEVDGSDTDEEADLLNFDDLDSDEFV